MELKLKMSATGPDGGLHYWLLADGEAVSYAKVYESTTASGCRVELCDIETRSDRRNLGYATTILRLIAEGYGVDSISHRGGYTPDGFNYISEKLSRIGEPATGPSCSPISFVHYWSTRTQKCS